MNSGDDLIIYNMGNNKKEDNDQSEIQLHKMKPQEHYIEAQVQEGDTLQAIALRFYCSISELKRINQIHKDNEIFARRTVKVPVTPYSVLTERLPLPQAEPVPSTSSHVPIIPVQDFLHNNNHNGQPMLDNLPREEKAINNTDYAIDCNTVVMNSTLAPSVVPFTDTELNDPVSEDTQLLPNKPKLSVEAVVVKELTSHGADFGLKWFHLACVILILCFVVPLLYILINVHKPEHENST
ncbi:lysM and putative peptidoglycan-binding domain-containing protein 3 isoform X2 [Ostrinia nubilalis]|nr:lysM and putative peptidoglycan-binding domain-containing protein 3 isoform X2 [Ostrinia furnacalis]